MYCLFKDVSSLVCITWNDRTINEEWIQKGTGRKWSWRDLRYYPRIYLVGLKKTMKYFSKHSLFQGRCLNFVPPYMKQACYPLSRGMKCFYHHHHHHHWNSLTLLRYHFSNQRNRVLHSFIVAQLVRQFLPVESQGSLPCSENYHPPYESSPHAHHFNIILLHTPTSPMWCFLPVYGCNCISCIVCDRC